MSAKQPTFPERINRLQFAGDDLEDIAQQYLKDDDELRESILLHVRSIQAEVERMKIANQRFERLRQARKLGTKKAPVKALHQVADEACDACQ